MRELFDLLKGYTEPDDSLNITEFPEIKRGVTLMMPLKEALEKLHIKQLLPSRQAVAFPGIPFFYRVFTNPDKDGFNLVYVITDAADRVVGLQYVCETPRQGIYGRHFGSEIPNLFFYNYINNRKRAVRGAFLCCSQDDAVQVQPRFFPLYGEAFLTLRRPSKIWPSHFIRGVSSQKSVKAGGCAIHVRVAASVQIPRGCGVPGSSPLGDGLCIICQETDVPQAGKVAKKQDVVRLHVTMHKTGFRQNLQSLQHRTDHSHDFRAANHAGWCL